MFGPHYTPHTNRCSFPLEWSISSDYEAIHTNRTTYPLAKPDKVEATNARRGGASQVGRDQANAGSARDASPSAIPSAASNSELGKESRSMPGYFPFPDEESFLKRRPARPSGSLGKPNDGGYSLPYTLGWDETSYRAVQLSLQGLANTILDVSSYYDNQDPQATGQYKLEAMKAFPFLRSYPDAWPAVDFATMYLKNKNDRARARKGKRGVEDV